MITKNLFLAAATIKATQLFAGVSSFLSAKRSQWQLSSQPNHSSTNNTSKIESKPSPINQPTMADLNSSKSDSLEFSFSRKAERGIEDVKQNDDGDVDENTELFK